MNIELRIPRSNIRAINDKTFTCGGEIEVPYGQTLVTWTTINKYTCEEIKAVQAINRIDNAPPEIMGCPKAVLINLGPGECGAYWNAPNFMAMDDCPASNFFGNEILARGCAYNGGNCQSGYMFDIENRSTVPLLLTGWEARMNTGTYTVEFYYTTTATTYVGNQSNPGAWTLCNRFFNVQGGYPNFTGGPGTGTPTRLNLATQRYDTIRQGCNPPMLDSNFTSCLLLNPGDRKGVYLTTTNPGNCDFHYGNGACAGGNPLGDANLAIYQPGVGKSYPFGGTFTPRHANISALYRKQEASNMVRVVQTCGQPYGPGCFFPIGCTTICFEATDAAGNTATCQFDVCVNAYPNSVEFLVCHDEIQVSLDENCSATISADEMLAGGPYRCYDDYIVEIRDWITNQLIDRDPNTPGSQVGVQDIGRELKITVRDPLTGNSCWGHATVEDKIAPLLTCPRDSCVPCATTETTPFFMGTPTVVENCGGYSLSYKDVVTYGGCAAQFEERIERTWTAIDGSGNKNSCVQTITVALATLNDVNVPLNYDDLEEPALACDEKIDPNKDLTPHYLAFPYCVDGYLLDSAHWFATGGFLPSPQGDLAGERLPRTLGWNCIDTGAYTGHPSPFPVYYPAHPSWRPNNPVCWGPDEIVMWHGTGYPSGSECSNLGMTYEDVVIDIARPGCDAGSVGCYKVLRKWTVLDWCTSEIGGHNQVIKVI
ncbi:MAG TPA: HYR domain-containing protein, partial [Saprospiraceae bacterium]|nr:HYR domain-containing protein [Saprospiraceae bacterium]